MTRQKQIAALLSVAFIAFIAIGVHSITKANNEVELHKIKLQTTNAELKVQKIKSEKLNKDLDVELNKNTANEQKIQQYEQQIDESKQREAELEKQVSIKKQRAASKTQLAANSLANKVTGTATASAAGNCGETTYKQFIYMHESHCSLTAVNSKGCIGIGQSCPGGSGLAADCPDWRTNWACQDAHFSQYASDRYGGWAGAYAAWNRQGWW